MIITVNGEQQSLQQESVLVSELLTINNVEMPDMVSVQLNESFVARQEFATTMIKNGDHIDFLYFMGGGSPITPADAWADYRLKGLRDHV